MVPPVGFLRNMPYQLRLANMGTAFSPTHRSNGLRLGSPGAPQVDDAFHAHGGTRRLSLAAGLVAVAVLDQAIVPGVPPGVAGAALKATEGTNPPEAAEAGVRAADWSGAH